MSEISFKYLPHHMRGLGALKSGRLRSYHMDKQILPCGASPPQLSKNQFVLAN